MSRHAKTAITRVILLLFVTCFPEYFSNAAPPVALPRPALDFSQLPQLPNTIGLAGPFVGAHQGALVVAGGANFSNKPLLEGGEKVWHDRVYILQQDSPNWNTNYRLPHPLAYGGSASTSRGIVLVGGSDSQRVTADAWLLQWDATESKLTQQQLPSLPQPTAKCRAVSIGDRVYVLAGQATKQPTSTIKKMWVLDLSVEPADRGWQELTPWPGKSRANMVVATQQRDDHPCLFLFSGVHVTAGDDEVLQREFLTDAYCYDPANDQWQQIASLPTWEDPRDIPDKARFAKDRASVTAGAAIGIGESSIYVFGGTTGRYILLPDGNPRPLGERPLNPDRVLKYDVATGHWSPVGRMLIGTLVTSAVHWHDQIVIPSGEVKPGIRTPQVQALRASEHPDAAPLFNSGDGAAEYRIPSMITTRAGTLIALCDARKDRGGDVPNNIDQVLRRSQDGGSTWSEVVTAVDLPGTHGAADPLLVQDRNSGRIFLFYGYCPGRNDVLEGANRDRRHLVLQYVTSDDDGQTWSLPVHIDPALRLDAWHSMWPGPGRGMQTRDGRLVVPCTVYKQFPDAATWSYLIISDDGGKSWRMNKTGLRDINEPTIVELRDGEWLINCRTQQKRRALAWTRDGGDSWSDVVYHQTLVAPGCQGSMMTCPGVVDGSPQDVVIFSNPASVRRRENMTVRASLDGGRTWPYAKVIESGDAAYSCLTVLPDGKLGLLFERPYSQIVLTRFSLSWLTDGDVRADR